MKRFFLLWLVSPAIACLLLGAAGLAAFQFAIRADPDQVFTREGILKILARESVVYYSDGQTKVGTFFTGAHRDYVPHDSIPPRIIEALVSAEDRNFFRHGGMDFKAFALAMLDNLKSGSLKRGGSTLTQQTAKNLFGRRGRTVRGKIEELVNAYRLERHFSKPEILEFYLNQFYVAGNGHGVRIASRYFFNKDLLDLNLVECAFIAGSVKGPNQYNPFLQETSEKKEAALKRGRTRVAYVLKQMRRQEKISEEEYRGALSQTLEFHRGAFRYGLSTNIVKVKRLLESPEMQDVLAKRDVGDYMTAGLQIYTTLDPDAQQAAEYAVYSNLWKLDLLLRGYHPPAESASVLVSHFIPGEFYTGRVEALEYKGGMPTALRVRFGALGGTVPQPALEAFFRQWNRHQIGADAMPPKKAVAEFAGKYLRPGQAVVCAVPYKTPEELTGGWDPGSQLELAQKPLLQGAAQVVREGRVLANVGGFGNTGYDRVNQAKRQFGSAFKPLVYAAALELGWKPLDPLPNGRQLFRLGDLFYFPKPDHPPEDTVSMAWAGRRSENIASVHLLFHLFDKANFARFWEECRSIRMAPENFAMPGEFEVFVRDSLGFVLDGEHLRELRYQKIIADLAIDLTFDGRLREAEFLRVLPYGAGFARERQKVAGSRDPEDQIRKELLERNYLDYAARAIEWRRGAPANSEWILARRESDGRAGVFERVPEREWKTLPRDEAPSAGDSLLVEGEVAVETLQRIADALHAGDGKQEGSRYSRENLFASPDFRALVALRYIVAFSRRLGIDSKLDPVLSYPLGVNAITLGEAVDAYQAFQDGCVYRTRFGQSQLYIEKVVTAAGETIFEDYAEREKVISDRTRFALEAILGAVVRGGTGQRIGRELRMPLGGGAGASVSVPAYGKTGTTNDYRNGAFLGTLAAPKGEGKGFDAASGYTIGMYSGFDDNTPMTRLGFRGTGAGVAVPAWLELAQTMVRAKKFSSRVDTSDIEAISTGEAPQFEREKYRRYAVSRRTGLPVSGEGGGAYAEDFSDELGMPGAPESAESGTASIWIREE